MDFDHAKENIQPLPTGRNVEQLSVVLNAESELELQHFLLEKRTEFENSIRNYNGNDPLEPWYEYILWVEQSYPRSGKQSALEEVLVKCLQNFESDDRYKQDARMIKLYIKYIDSQPNPQENYQILYNNGVGTIVADLYIGWAYYYDICDNFEKAEEIFRKGKDAHAEPKEMLEEAHRHFGYTMSQRLLHKDENSRKDFLLSMEEKRFALTSLRPYRHNKVGSIRTGAAIKNLNPGLVKQDKKAIDNNRPNARVAVYNENHDPNIHMSVQSSISTGPVSIVQNILSSTSKQENNREPGPWTKAKNSSSKSRAALFSDNDAVDMAFSILEDNSESVNLCTVSDEQMRWYNSGIHLPENFCRKNDPQTDFIVPKYIPEPVQPNVIPAYDKIMISPAEDQLYSIEELMAYKWFTKRNIQNKFTEKFHPIWRNDGYGPIRLPPLFCRKNDPQTEFIVKRDESVGKFPNGVAMVVNLEKLMPADGSPEMSIEEHLKQKWLNKQLMSQQEMLCREDVSMDETIAIKGRISVYGGAVRKSVFPGGRKSIIPLNRSPDVQNSDLEEDVFFDKEQTDDLPRLSIFETFKKPTDVLRKQPPTGALPRRSILKKSSSTDSQKEIEFKPSSDDVNCLPHCSNIKQSQSINQIHSKTSKEKESTVAFDLPIDRDVEMFRQNELPEPNQLRLQIFEDVASERSPAAKAIKLIQDNVIFKAPIISEARAQVDKDIIQQSIIPEAKNIFKKSIVPESRVQHNLFKRSIVSEARNQEDLFKGSIIIDKLNQKDLFKEPIVSEARNGQDLFKESIVPEPRVQQDLFKRSIVSEAKNQQDLFKRSIIPEAINQKNLFKEPMISEARNRPNLFKESIVPEPKVQQDLLKRPNVSETKSQQDLFKRSIVPEPKKQEDLLKKSFIPEAKNHQSLFKGSVVPEGRTEKDLFKESTVPEKHIQLDQDLLKLSPISDTLEIKKKNIEESYAYLPNDSCTTAHFNLFIKQESVSTPVALRKKPNSPERMEYNDENIAPTITHYETIGDAVPKQLYTIMETTESNTMSSAAASTKSSVDTQSHSSPEDCSNLATTSIKDNITSDIQRKSHILSINDRTSLLARKSTKNDQQAEQTLSTLLTNSKLPQKPEQTEINQYQPMIDLPERNATVLTDFKVDDIFEDKLKTQTKTTIDEVSIDPIACTSGMIYKKPQQTIQNQNQIIIYEDESYHKSVQIEETVPSICPIPIYEDKTETIPKMLLTVKPNEFVDPSIVNNENLLTPMKSIKISDDNKVVNNLTCDDLCDLFTQTPKKQEPSSFSQFNVIKEPISNIESSKTLTNTSVLHSIDGISLLDMSNKKTKLESKIPRPFATAHSSLFSKSKIEDQKELNRFEEPSINIKTEPNTDSFGCISDSTEKSKASSYFKMPPSLPKKEPESLKLQSPRTIRKSQFDKDLQHSDDEFRDDGNDDIHNSIYVYRSPVKFSEEKHANWEEINSSKSIDESDNSYTHKAIDLNETNMTIENCLIGNKIDPFDLNLRNAFLDRLYFIDYLSKISDCCTLISRIRPLKPKLSFNIGAESFNVMALIGEGSYGQIYSAKNKNNGKIYALKQERPPNLWEYYICLEIQARISHQNILKGFMVVDYSLIGNNASILASQYSPYGTLLNVCNKVKASTGRNVDQYVVMVLAIQMLSIIDHLHASNIIHADIKPDNFLLMKKINPAVHQDLCIQLIDFGQAIDMKLFPNNQTFNVKIQTENFTCIEMLENRPWSYQTDLFCLAATIYTILMGKYLKLFKNTMGYSMQSSIPRYYDKSTWESILYQLINIRDSTTLPNLQSLRDTLLTEIVNKEKYANEKILQFNRSIGE